MVNNSINLFTEEEIRQIKEDCTSHFREELKDDNGNNYELLPPYSNKEISDFEEIIGEELEPYLRSYLLTVSRQIMGNQYPYFFGLSVHKNFQLRTCLIPEGLSYWCYKKLNQEDDHRFGDGMLEIGSGGCSNADMIVLRGNNLGSVWIGNGDNLEMHRKKSFKEYVIYHSNWW